VSGVRIRRHNATRQNVFERCTSARLGSFCGPGTRPGGMHFVRAYRGFWKSEGNTACARPPSPHLEGMVGKKIFDRRVAVSVRMHFFHDRGHHPVSAIYPAIIISESNHNIQSTPLSASVTNFFSVPNAFFFTEVDPVSMATRATCGRSGGFAAYNHT